EVFQDPSAFNAPVCPPIFCHKELFDNDKQPSSRPCSDSAGSELPALPRVQSLNPRRDRPGVSYFVAQSKFCWAISPWLGRVGVRSGATRRLPPPHLPCGHLLPARRRSDCSRALPGKAGVHPSRIPTPVRSAPHATGVSPLLQRARPAPKLPARQESICYVMLRFPGFLKISEHLLSTQAMISKGLRLTAAWYPVALISMQPFESTRVAS